MATNHQNTDAATIARGLTSAQKRALLWLPGDGDWSPTRAFWKVATQIKWLVRDGLVERKEVGWNGAGADCRWRLTPLGLAVRAELERMEAGDGI